MDITLEQFRDGTGSTQANAELYYQPALITMDRFAINAEVQRIAAFLSTISIEAARLTTMEEGLSYRDPARLHQIFPSKFPTVESAVLFVRNPEALSQKLYGGYHGRGAIQITWLRNYQIHGDRLGFDYVNNPHWLLTPDHAILSAGDYWDKNNINDVADDMDEVTLRVNGRARMHLAERIAQRNVALEVLA